MKENKIEMYIRAVELHMATDRQNKTPSIMATIEVLNILKDIRDNCIVINKMTKHEQKKWEKWKAKEFTDRYDS